MQRNFQSVTMFHHVIMVRLYLVLTVLVFLLSNAHCHKSPHDHDDKYDANFVTQNGITASTTIPITQSVANDRITTKYDIGFKQNKKLDNANSQIPLLPSIDPSVRS